MKSTKWSFIKNTRGAKCNLSIKIRTCLRNGIVRLEDKNKRMESDMPPYILHAGVN